MSRPPQPLLDRTLAVSWEEHRRTREVCAAFGLPLHTLTDGGTRFGRYVRLSLATIGLLQSRRPRVVYVQNPSLVLALLVLAARRFFGNYRVVMDAHNEAVVPFSHPRWPIPSLTRLALQAADSTIVTNAALADIVARSGGRPIVLPDRLPVAPMQPSRPPLDGTIIVMVIATYAADEPIAAIVEAARLLGTGFEFRFTGRETRMSAETRSMLPANVMQTGFLLEHDYWQLMADCHVVLDLTLKPNCLVCGAYEALAMRKPMVLSNNAPSVELFARVAVFSASAEPADIASALRTVQNEYAALVERCESEPSAFERRWQLAAASISDRLQLWLGTAP